MKPFSNRRFSQLTWILFASMTFVSFQNCSKGGFVSPSTPTDLASQGGDLDVPTITLLSAVPELTNSRNLTVGFNVTIDSSVSLVSATCQLDSATPVDCLSLSSTFTNIADGDHRLTI